jgi:hypothetical protein
MKKEDFYTHFMKDALSNDMITIKDSDRFSFALFNFYFSNDMFDLLTKHRTIFDSFLKINGVNDHICRKTEVLFDTLESFNISMEKCITRLISNMILVNYKYFETNKFYTKFYNKYFEKYLLNIKHQTDTHFIDHSNMEAIKDPINSAFYEILKDNNFYNEDNFIKKYLPFLFSYLRKTSITYRISVDKDNVDLDKLTMEDFLLMKDSIFIENYYSLPENHDKIYFEKFIFDIYKISCINYLQQKLIQDINSGDKPKLQSVKTDIEMYYIRTAMVNNTILCDIKEKSKWMKDDKKLNISNSDDVKTSRSYYDISLTNLYQILISCNRNVFEDKNRTKIIPIIRSILNSFSIIENDVKTYFGKSFVTEKTINKEFDTFLKRYTSAMEKNKIDAINSDKLFKEKDYALFDCVTSEEKIKIVKIIHEIFSNVDNINDNMRIIKDMVKFVIYKLDYQINNAYKFSLTNELKEYFSNKNTICSLYYNIKNEIL